MTPDEAIAQGALALFGEKYGDEVRVVSMGMSDKSAKAGHAYSIELCGGTHVRRTGDIGLLKIVSESAVASGVRRIEALTGEAARDYLAAQDERVREAAELLKVSPDEMITRLAAIIDERRKLERQLADAKRELALGGGVASGGDGAAATVRDLGKVKLLARTVHGVAPKDLRGLVDDAKKQLGSGVVAVIGVSEEGKAGLVVGVTDDLTAHLRRGRARPHRRRGARRQRRRRPPRSRPGRRPRRRPCRSGARSDRRENRGGGAGACGRPPCRSQAARLSA